jgi:hypothetical protein
MAETERSQHHVIQRAFGPDSHLDETAPTESTPGRIEIHLDGGMIGSGRTFPAAIADSLAFTMPGVVRASDTPHILGVGEHHHVERIRRFRRSNIVWTPIESRSATPTNGPRRIDRIPAHRRRVRAYPCIMARLDLAAAHRWACCLASAGPGCPRRQITNFCPRLAGRQPEGGLLSQRPMKDR